MTTMQEDRANNLSLAKHLGEFQSHKIVRAAEILAIEPTSMVECGIGGGAVGHPTIIGYSLDMKGLHDERVAAFVSVDWLKKHDPQVGGYFVVYADGYGSYSPKEAFENGNTWIG